MNIENHPKLIKLVTAPTKKKSVAPDMTVSKVSDSREIQVSTEYAKCTYKEMLFGLDCDNAALFCTVTKVNIDVDRTDVLAPGIVNAMVYGDFVRRLVKTFIGTKSMSGSISEGLRKSLTNSIGGASNNDGTYGTNSMSESDIMEMLTRLPAEDLILIEDELYLKETYLYLPITINDTNGNDLSFTTFSEKDQATIRAAKRIASNKTYIRIILLDGTEFNLWYDKLDLIIIGKY